MTKASLSHWQKNIDRLLPRLQDGISIVIKTMAIKKKKKKFESHFDHLQNAY